MCRRRKLQTLAERDPPTKHNTQQNECDDGNHQIFFTQQRRDERANRKTE